MWFFQKLFKLEERRFKLMKVSFIEKFSKQRRLKNVIEKMFALLHKFRNEGNEGKC